MREKWIGGQLLLETSGKIYYIRQIQSARLGTQEMVITLTPNELRNLVFEAMKMSIINEIYDDVTEEDHEESSD